MKVSFFGPFYSDYRVMLLDPDYKWNILSEAVKRGYDVSKLI